MNISSRNESYEAYTGNSLQAAGRVACSLSNSAPKCENAVATHLTLWQPTLMQSLLARLFIDAAQFQQALEGRLGKFQLSLAPEKTRSFRFNRFFVGGEKFDFLGFTFRWSKNSKGNPQVWRQTAKDRFRRALSRLKEWLRKARNLPMKELMKTLKSKYRGHRNYYGVVGNKNLLDSFVFFANGIVFKWLNRRSQRRSYNWEGFRQAIKYYGLEEANIEKIAA